MFRIIFLIKLLQIWQILALKENIVKKQPKNNLTKSTSLPVVSIFPVCEAKDE